MIIRKYAGHVNESIQGPVIIFGGLLLWSSREGSLGHKRIALDFDQIIYSFFPLDMSLPIIHLDFIVCMHN